MRHPAYIHTVLLLWSASLVLGLAGCDNTRSVEKKNFYLLPQTTPQQTFASCNSTLKVRQFHTIPPFDNLGIIYRTGPFEFRQDYYDQFLTSPDVQLTEHLRVWMGLSGLFKHVLASNSTLNPDYTLESYLQELYCDLTDKSAPEAAMRVQFTLIKNDAAGLKQGIVFEKTYTSRKSVAIFEGEAIIAALNTVKTDIFNSLTLDLNLFFNRRTETPSNPSSQTP